MPSLEANRANQVFLNIRTITTITHNMTDGKYQDHAKQVKSKSEKCFCPQSFRVVNTFSFLTSFISPAGLSKDSPPILHTGAFSGALAVPHLVNGQRPPPLLKQGRVCLHTAASIRAMTCRLLSSTPLDAVRLSLSGFTPCLFLGIIPLFSFFFFHSSFFTLYQLQA
jgi:hypothetical protein